MSTVGQASKDFCCWNELATIRLIMCFVQLGDLVRAQLQIGAVIDSDDLDRGPLGEPRQLVRDGMAVADGGSNDATHGPSLAWRLPRTSRDLSTP